MGTNYFICKTDYIHGTQKWINISVYKCTNIKYGYDCNHMQYIISSLLLVAIVNIILIQNDERTWSNIWKTRIKSFSELYGFNKIVTMYIIGEKIAFRSQLLELYIHIFIYS